MNKVKLQYIIVQSSSLPMQMQDLFCESLKFLQPKVKKLIINSFVAVLHPIKQSNIYLT